MPTSQVAVIEFARNVLGLKEAHSAEFDAATPTPAVVFMPEGSKTHKGGTMRLGARKTILQTMDCITARLYQACDAATFYVLSLQRPFLARVSRTSYFL